MNIFLLGAGYSARAYARLVAGGAASIAGTTRSADGFDALRAAGIAPLTFDGTRIGPEMAEALKATTHLVLSAAPMEKGPSPSPLPSPRARGEGGVNVGAPPAMKVWRDANAPLSPSLRGEGKGEGQLFRERQSSIDPLLPLLPSPVTQAMPALRWVGYLSTVGVYGDHQGAVVTEESELRATSRRTVARVEAERAWIAAGEVAGVAVAVLRLAGIYGPGRNALVNLERGTARRVVKPGQVFNRIHVADIAGALEHLGSRETGGIFNVCDDEPGPPQDVIAFAAKLMGVEPPPEIPFDEVEMTPMARSFWGDNKRVSNALLKRTGYPFRFPNHRMALEAMWREQGSVLRKDS